MWHGSAVSTPSITAQDVAWITADQMREVDRVMIEDLHIDLVQMMENAGRNLARVVLDEYGPDSVAVYAGSGGNGGGGLVAARHLHNAGARVTVVLAKEPDQLAPVPRHQLDILERMRAPIRAEPVRADVAVDALIGYSLRGDPRARTAELIDAVNGTDTVVALDTPSGLDVTTGVVGTPCVDADATLTLALPKVGLRSAPVVGRLFLADISVPPFVYDGLGIGPAPDFRRGPVLAVDPA